MKLILALFSLLSVPVQQEGELEVIFVVDSSNSMKRNDPEALRTQIAGAMVDFLGRNRPVTVSIVQFAGWNESQKEKVVLLTRKKDQKEISAALKDLPSFGDASDINVAFEIGIPEILKERDKAGTKGPLWIVILTDGEFDVIEGGEIRPEYEKLAEKDTPELFEEEPDVALNRAALRILSQTLESRYRDIPLIVSGINLGREKVDQKSTFHKLVTLEGKQEGRVLQIDQSVLMDVIVPLLMQSPDWKKGRETFYGHRPAGAEEAPFHLYPGSTEANTLAWGSSADYSLDPSGIEHQKSGAGTSYRLLSFDPASSANVPLNLGGGGASGVEMVFHIVTGLKPAIRRTGNENLSSTQPFQAEATIQNEKGETVSGKTLTAALSGTARLILPGGEQVVSPLQFKSGSRADCKLQRKKALTGQFRLDCEATLKLPGALHTLDLGRSTGQADYLILSTYTATFEKGETWIGRKTRITVEPAPGKEMEIKLAGEGNPTLSINAEGEAFFQPAETGDWNLEDGEYPGFFLKAGSISALKIKPRGIRIFQAGKEVESLQADIRFREKETYPLDIRIEVDRDENEEVRISFTFEGREGITLVREDGKVILDVATVEDLPSSIGKAKITATVSGETIPAELPVEIRYTDKTAKLFQKALPYLIGALVALLLLTAFLMLHRFGERQLWIYKAGKLSLSSHLRDWKRGLSGRKAFGTEEKPRTILFRMHGMKRLGKAKCTVRKVGDADVFHKMATLPEKEKRELAHGDEILISSGIEEWHCYYFERTPTSEEILSRQSVLEEDDELFLEDE